MQRQIQTRAGNCRKKGLVILKKHSVYEIEKDTVVGRSVKSDPDFLVARQEMGGSSL
jgi:hypothetical protein